MGVDHARYPNYERRRLIWMPKEFCFQLSVREIAEECRCGPRDFFPNLNWDLLDVVVRFLLVAVVGWQVVEMRGWLELLSWSALHSGSGRFLDSQMQMILGQASNSSASFVQKLDFEMIFCYRDVYDNSCLHSCTC